MGRRCLWPCVRQLGSVMGVYFNSWVQHTHVHTRPFAVPSPSFIFQLDYSLSVSFVWFSLFPFPLTSLNKHTWCLVYSRPHMGSQLLKHNSTTSILPGTLQSSHISIFLSLCSALLLHFHCGFYKCCPEYCAIKGKRFNSNFVSRITGRKRVTVNRK